MTLGTFAWRELIHPQPTSVAHFYASVFGWSAGSMDMGGAPYHLWKIDPEGQGIAGGRAPMMPGVPNFWMDYIRVDDLQHALDVAVTHGATPLTPPIDAPVGRFVLIQDPAGAVFGLFQQPDAMPDPDGPPAPGTFCWSELHTPDVEGATRFYGALFGWSASPMGGPMSRFADGEQGRASMMPASGRARWLQYVAVPDVGAAYHRALEAGATPVQGPTPLPGLGELAVFADPSGAVLGLWKNAP